MKNSITTATPFKQRGLTMISWMVVLVFLLSQAVILMNVIPVYMTDSTVAKIIENLPNDDHAKRANHRELKILVLKRLNINSVYSIKPEYIKVKKGRNENIVLIEYEPRGTLLGSLDYIVTFKHEARVQTR